MGDSCRTPIEKALNIGPVVGAELREMGITTVGELRRVGWAEVWDQLRRSCPARNNHIAAQTLAGAAMGIHWLRVPKDVKLKISGMVRRFRFRN